MKNYIVIIGALLALSSCAGGGSREQAATANSETAWVLPDSYRADDGESASDSVTTVVADDGKMCFHNWDTGNGGAMPLFGVVCQFIADDGSLVTVDMKDMEGIIGLAWVRKLYTINKDDGTTYYIAVRTLNTGSDGYMWIDGFAIDGKSLKRVNEFDGVSEAVVDDDDTGVVNFSIPDFYFATFGEGWNWLFDYDRESHDLYMPLTLGDGRQITDRYTLLHFDGKTFVSKGEVPHRGLCPDLANYVCLEKFCRTGSHIVRVDRIDDAGTLRLAVWKSTADISQRPDQVIVGGKYDEGSEEYTFAGDGTTYVVPHTETTTDTGGNETDKFYLLIKRDGNDVDKEEIIVPAL